MSVFASVVFYTLDDGIGTVVQDALGNGPDGVITGTTTGVWANADCFTINEASGGVGDNAIRLQGGYIDDLLRLDNLNGTIVAMWQLNQPQPPSSGAQCILSYGDINSNVDGGYAIYADTLGLIYSVRGGATWVARGGNCAQALSAAQNNQWFSYGVQIDVIDGQCVIAAYINGYPYWGARAFDLEGYLPRIASSGCGARLLAAAYGINGASQFLLGQTRVKRFLIGRVVNDARHDIPKWAKQYHEVSSGIPPFVTE